jgi:hypothetical protein
LKSVAVPTNAANSSAVKRKSPPTPSPRRTTNSVLANWLSSPDLKRLKPVAVGSARATPVHGQSPVETFTDDIDKALLEMMSDFESTRTKTPTKTTPTCAAKTGRSLDFHQSTALLASSG